MTIIEANSLDEAIAATRRRHLLHIPADVMGHMSGLIEAGQVRLAHLLEARIEALEYEWAWADAICAPEEL